MSNDQIKFTTSGPVFEFGPGWGTKTKIWLRKYFLKAVVPAVVFLFVLVLLTRGLDKLSERAQLTATPNLNKSVVALTVARGDGPVLAARRALTEYLKSYPEELTVGQKIFIEEILRKGISGQKLVVGGEVNFDLNSIKGAISQSKNLSPYQLQVWEGYAKGVKF